MASFGVEQDIPSGVTLTVQGSIQVAPYNSQPTQQAAVGVASGQVLSSAADNIAAAGTTQANATPIYNNFNRITTAATGSGVLLPPSVSGMNITVLVGGIAGTTFKVWPNGTDTINGGGAGAAYTVTKASASIADFYCATAGAWHAIQGT